MVQAHPIRLQPGDDLVPALIDAAKKAMSGSPKTGCAFVLSAVGSLKDVTLRLATASHQEKYDSCETKRVRENLEVVSLVGTFTPSGEKHLHMSVSDGKGHTYGGHLLAGVVFTTLELVLGTIANVSFDRELDESTGYNELIITQTAEDPPASETMLGTTSS
jgi:predicted DNA-binding protein with PD1-like motif